MSGLTILMEYFTIHQSGFSDIVNISFMVLQFLRLFLLLNKQPA